MAQVRIMEFKKSNAKAAADKVYEYEPLGKLAKILKGLFITAIVVLTLQLAVDLWGTSVGNQITAGVSVSQDDLDLLDVCSGLVGIVSAVLCLIMGILFLRWFYLLRRNMTALKAPFFEGHPLDVVGAFIIPLVNLFKPQSHAQDIFKATDLNFPSERHWKDAPSSLLILVWWLFFVAQNRTNQVAVGLISRSIKQESPHQSLPLIYTTSAVGDGLAVVAAVLAIKVIVNLTERQQKYHAAIVGGEHKSFSEVDAPPTEFSQEPTNNDSAEQS